MPEGSPYLPPPPSADQPMDAVVVALETDVPGAVSMTNDGVLKIEQPDGSVVIDLNPAARAKPGDDSKWFANLADRIDPGKLGLIADELLTAIDADNQTRADWLATRTRGLDLLGLKLESPGGDAGASTAPLEGMSRVRHPALLEAVLRFQANARGELLPADGPAKIDNTGQDTTERDELAEALEKEFNNYLTITATEYYPDTDAMLFMVGAGGCEFKKVYRCPLRKRPVSEWVKASDLIVNNTATDLRNAERVTHQVMMRSSMVKRLQRIGHYRDVPLSPPNEQPNPVDEKKANIEGVAALPQRVEDQRHTIYETLCELDLPDFAPRGWSGIMLPFKVSIDKDSRQVLEVCRNWDRDDEQCLPLNSFVKYPYVPGIGFYDIGLINIMGNATSALTAGWREGLDAGMFANFPGFLYTESAGKQLTNQFRIPPGGGQRIQTQGKIGDSVMPLPYKDVSPGFVAFLQWIEGITQRVGGTAETGVGEGNANAPVGTTLALIEQATQVVGAVLKRLHQAQGEEFRMLKDLFKADPEAMWRSTPQRRRARQWNKDEMLKAIEDNDLVPASDPNVPGHLARMMRASALIQMMAADPTAFDKYATYKHAFAMMKIGDAKTFLIPPQPTSAPPSDAVILATAQVETAKIRAESATKDTQAKAAIELVKAEDREKDRAAKERHDAQELELEKLRLASSLTVHPETVGVIQPYLPPTMQQ